MLRHTKKTEKNGLSWQWPVKGSLVPGLGEYRTLLAYWHYWNVWRKQDKKSSPSGLQDFDEHMEHPGCRKVRFTATCSASLWYDYCRPAVCWKGWCIFIFLRMLYDSHSDPAELHLQGLIRKRGEKKRIFFCHCFCWAHWCGKCKFEVCGGFCCCFF